MKKYIIIGVESIIGKKYYPFDNSYCVNLTSCSNHPYENDTTSYLAGTMGGDSVKECEIVSEPFTCNVVSSNDCIKTIEMILVNYNGNTYSIMYNEKYVK